jgi:RNA polymerase sigma-70 factor (ECF subfamily)
LDSTSTRKLGFFFSDHHRWLLQHINKRLRNRADAEDTAAEAFCQMLGARVDPDSIQQPRAYLSTIARRLIFDRHRRRQLEQAYLDRLALLPEPVAPSAEEQLLLLERWSPSTRCSMACRISSRRPSSIASSMA